MNIIGRIEGLKPVTPQGAMYMMVGIEVEKFRDIESDVDFSAKLLAEENVICLPGEVSNIINLMVAYVNRSFYSASSILTSFAL
jgi:tyrosine aminotransferase